MSNCESCFVECSDDDQGLCDECFRVMPMGEWVSASRIVSNINDDYEEVNDGRVTLDV